MTATSPARRALAVIVDGGALDAFDPPGYRYRGLELMLSRVAAGTPVALAATEGGLLHDFTADRGSWSSSLTRLRSSGGRRDLQAAIDQVVASADRIGFRETTVLIVSAGDLDIAEPWSLLAPNRSFHILTPYPQAQAPPSQLYFLSTKSQGRFSPLSDPSQLQWAMAETASRAAGEQPILTLSVSDPAAGAIEFPVDRTVSSLTLTVVHSGPHPSLTLRDPTGVSLGEAAEIVPDGQGESHLWYAVQAPAPGRWSLILELAGGQIS